MDRDFMGDVIKDINRPKTKYDIEKQYWIEYSEELQARIDKAIEYIEKKEEKQIAYNFDYWLDDDEIKELLDILKGSDKSE